MKVLSLSTAAAAVCVVCVSTSASLKGQKPGAPETPTFDRDVAPILYKHCASCHRSGQIAPFPLLTYSDASKRAALIATVVDPKIETERAAENG